MGKANMAIKDPNEQFCDEEDGWQPGNPERGRKILYKVVPSVVAAIVVFSLIGYLPTLLLPDSSRTPHDPRSEINAIATEIAYAKDKIGHLPTLLELKEFIDPGLYNSIHEVGKKPIGASFKEFYFIFYDSRDGITTDPDVRAVGAYPVQGSSRKYIYYRTTETGATFRADKTKTSMPATLKYLNELDPNIWMTPH
jgi:hypothetical protein